MSGSAGVTFAAIEQVREALHFCADVHGDRSAQAVDALPSLAALQALAEAAAGITGHADNCDCLTGDGTDPCDCGFIALHDALRAVVAGAREEGAADG